MPTVDVETTNDESTDVDNLNSDYETVISRKTKKRRYLSQLSNGQEKTLPTLNLGETLPAGTSWSDVVVSSPNLNEPKDTVIVKQKKTLRLIGRSKPANITNATSKVLKSAKPYIRKNIFAVYNVDNDETVATLEEFVEEVCGEKPLSCFKVTSSVSSSSTYRVCIDSTLRDKFLNPELWYSGIVIRPWKFKPKDAKQSAENNKSQDGDAVKESDASAANNSTNIAGDAASGSSRMEADTDNVLT